jgi:hypothetical protein
MISAIRIAQMILFVVKLVVIQLVLMAIVYNVQVVHNAKRTLEVLILCVLIINV